MARPPVQSAADRAAKTAAATLVRTWSAEALSATAAPGRLVAAWGLSHLAAQEVLADELLRRRRAAQ